MVAMARGQMRTAGHTKARARAEDCRGRTVLRSRTHDALTHSRRQLAPAVEEVALLMRLFRATWCPRLPLWLRTVSACASSAGATDSA